MATKTGFTHCYRMGCTNPAVLPTDDDLPACGKHGGETPEVWTLYNRKEDGWLTDNDTLIEWVKDVDDARWFASSADAVEWAVENELWPACAAVRLK